MSLNLQHDNNRRFVRVLFTFITTEIYSSWIVSDFIYILTTVTYEAWILLEIKTDWLRGG